MEQNHSIFAARRSVFTATRAAAAVLAASLLASAAGCRTAEKAAERAVEADSSSVCSSLAAMRWSAATDAETARRVSIDSVEVVVVTVRDTVEHLVGRRVVYHGVKADRVGRERSEAGAEASELTQTSAQTRTRADERSRQRTSPAPVGGRLWLAAIAAMAVGALCLFVGRKR